MNQQKANYKSKKFIKNFIKISKNSLLTRKKNSNFLFRQVCFKKYEKNIHRVFRQAFMKGIIQKLSNAKPFIINILYATARRIYLCVSEG